MSTTLQGFVASSQGAVITSGNAAKGNVSTYPAVNCNQLTQGGFATRLDSLVDLSAAGYAKNAGFYLSLSASTPITVDATAIASAATASAGDNSLATVNSIELTNLGTTVCTYGAAASNPLLAGLAGTAPTVAIPANGGKVVIRSAAGFSTSGALNMKFDPGGSAAQIGVALGGA